MKWSHLPVGGGIYDQHPKLLDDWLTIMGIDGEQEEKRMREQKKEKAPSASRVARRGR
jgi:hypothetical protein